MEEGHRKKILIIEDDRMLLEILADKLGAEGFDIARAADGEAGFDMIWSEKPDLILLDVFMPKKDGIAVLRDIQKKDPDFSTPIIVLSNSNDTSNIANAISNRAVAYFIKSDQDLGKIIEIAKEKIAA